MSTVKIIDIIGSSTAVSPRLGIKTYEYLVDTAGSDFSIEVSFEGVEDLTSAFCNAFIGKLYMNFPPDILKSNFKISGIDEDHIWFKKVNNAILLGTNENVRTLHNSNLAEVIFA